MEITLNTECEEYIRDQIKSGKFTSLDEVIQKAVRLMHEQEQRQLEELRKEITIGIVQIDQGLSSEFDESTIQRVKDRARRRRQQLREETHRPIKESSPIFDETAIQRIKEAARRR